MLQCCALRGLKARGVTPQPARIALVAIFSMLCTRQYSCHCVATFVLPRSVKRLIRLCCLMFANTGSTVAMRRLYSARPRAESMALRMRTLR